jgi:hypothetical protein
MDLADLASEDDIVEFLHHLTGTELSEVSSLFAGWTAGVLLRHGGEVGSTFDFGLELGARIFGIDQYVPGAGSHCSYSYSGLARRRRIVSISCQAGDCSL